MNKKKRYLTLFILIIFSLLIIVAIPSHSNAGNPITDPNSYAPSGFSTDEANLVMSKAGIVFNTITTVGIIASVITIIVIGIKYMIGSIEEKAEYKKTMMPYIIGVFMIMSISAILKLIASLTANFF